MSTMQILPPNAPPAHSPLSTVREAVRWVRETPSPQWEGDAGDKATFLGYVGASMLVWIAVGVLGMAAVGEGLKALASVLG
ncbi:chemotaxis protein CheW [Actinotalea sp. K2]|uniref:chemotaxis protein CheW n=1 Tax=Actinotalea sp. K2 TaxID=2939438 RepID=UPI002017BBEF|nr:chemotaxis protein CheW [Actinotalea sp. K2]MCL3860987.1 chemotaxis protein CheW [Actinotalea sp. K2]